MTLGVGDVVLVHRRCTDRQTGKPYVWRFFAVITKPGTPYRYRVIRLGDDKARLMEVFARPGQDEVFPIPEDQWPDGVWALRTKLILEGVIDIT